MFQLTVKEYQEIVTIIPDALGKITMVAPYSPYEEEYFYWPGFTADDIGKVPGNFINGEQDVLVGAPNQNEIGIIYQNTDMFDEAADALEEVVGG